MTTREEALALAREVGYEPYSSAPDYFNSRMIQIARIIDLAKKQENEACAKTAEGISAFEIDGNRMRDRVTSAIRARVK